VCWWPAPPRQQINRLYKKGDTNDEYCWETDGKVVGEDRVILQEQGRGRSRGTTGGGKKGERVFLYRRLCVDSMGPFNDKL